MIVQRKNKPVNRIFGGGILDYMTSIHTFDKMPEFHTRQNIFGQKYNFNGPMTRLQDRMLDIEKRIPKPKSKPINKIDEYAMHHDLDYGEIKKVYEKTNKTKEDKKHHMKLIHEADERFIKGMQTPEARQAGPIISRISEYAIKGKKALDKYGVFPVYGLGIKEGRKKKADPAKRLRMLINKPNHKEQPKHNSEKHYKHSNTNYIIKKLLENKVITI